MNTSSARRAATVLVIVTSLGSASAAAAEDKRQLAVTVQSFGGTNDQVRILSPTGALVRTFPATLPNSASWSRDEKTVAYGDAGGLRLVPAAGGAATTLVPTGDHPSWSPVADKIAYWTSNPSLNGVVSCTLHVIGAGGGNDQVIAGQRQSCGPATWSPDGKTLAWGESYPGVIVSAPASGGSPTPIVSAGPGEYVEQPAYSPDGKRIAYVHYFPGGRDQIVVRDLATGAETVVVDHPPPALVETFVAGQISWSADSEQIAFVEQELFGNTGQSALYRVVAVKADGTGGRRVLMQENNGSIGGLAWANAPRQPNYYIKHIEVAQAISPDLDPLPPLDPLFSDPYLFHWSVPSVYGYKIPMVADKRTLVRIYVGDASLAPLRSEPRTVKYRVSGPTLANPIEGEQIVDVAAPDAPADQTHAVGALNVWLPPSAAAEGAASLHVAINTDAQGQEVQKECGGCFPNGNEANVDGLVLARGGSASFVLVNIDLIDKAGGNHRPSDRYRDIWPLAWPLLPIRDGGLTVFPPIVPRDEFSIYVGDLTSGNWRHRKYYACEVVLSRLDKFFVLPRQAAPGTVSGAVRGVGVVGPEGFDFPCGGIADGVSGRGSNFLVTTPDANTVVHEFGHTLGLPHALGFGEVPTQGASVALPYFPGIGGVGYNPLRPNKVYNKTDTGDIMSYSPNRWTSPWSWQLMFGLILAESLGGPTPDVHSSATSSRVQSARAQASGDGPYARRRLVSGVVIGRQATILDSEVVVAAAPRAAGPVVARLAALDRNGRRVATVDIHGDPKPPPGEPPPFLVSLPATERVASLQVQPRGGGKPLAELKASKHPPTGRFARLPKRASKNKRLTVRWAASDRDSRDRLSVILQARRGRRAWQTITMGPARLKATVDPKALGGGKKLSLRLIVSDGFDTTNVNAPPISLTGR